MFCFKQSVEQCRRYEALIAQCKAVSGPTDIAHVARTLPAPQGRPPTMKRPFVAPQPPPPPDPADGTDAQDLTNVSNKSHYRYRNLILTIKLGKQYNNNSSSSILVIE